MPLLLKIKLLDSSGKIINIDYDKDKKLMAKLILEKDNNNIDLIVTQYNDESFIIKPAINSMPDLLHLPVYFSQSQYYFIQITYDNTVFYSLLSLKETNVQCPLIVKYQISRLKHMMIKLQYLYQQIYQMSNKFA